MGTRSEPVTRLPKLGVQAARLEAEGKSTEDILLALYGDIITPTEHKKYKRLLQKWRDLPQYDEVYQDVIKKSMRGVYARSLQVMEEQMNDANPWIRNKAANDLASRFGPVLMGEKDKETVIRIEGGPVLGMPSPDDTISVDAASMPALGQPESGTEEAQ